ncbi:hypothetical protein, conserved [Trypanosoma cruzi]|uniref:Uncharacterized protein n=1 Tax=Trypanosoma cruzi (strain CL Brener) TaxID=353153 RepID=Q4DPQ7_TRYCC|nr:hypothetical protein, conserved [Trypanosoma cruzi]EAN94516.1 hypothetical protein, conserved [Trypanosoma cruzi]|eukprot:XP_816367.1 hypothetical protein [Trypanosoma cruzi strain CL Brener]
MQRKIRRPVRRRRRVGLLLPKLAHPVQETETDDEDGNAPLGTSFSPSLQAQQSVRLASTSFKFSRAVSLSRSNTSATENIEGELWYVTSNMGPGKRATLAMQWVTCDDHKLTVSSGWSERGRIIDMMQFDGIRVIFSFSHVHEHFASLRQAPITRIVRRDDNGNSIYVNVCKKDKEDSRNDYQPPRRAMREFRLCEGKLRPRYYYFGIEFSEHRDNTGAPRRRQRRLIIFATDIKSDQQAWLNYFASLGDLKCRSISKTSNTHGCFSVQDESHSQSLPEPQSVGRLNLEERDWGSSRSYEPLEFAATGRPGSESSPFLVDFDELSESHASAFPRSRHNEQLRNYLIAQLTDEETRLRKTLFVEEDSDRRRLCAVRQALSLAFRDNNLFSAWTSTRLAKTGTTDDATLAACGLFFPQCEKVSPETSQCVEFITDTIKMLQRTITEKNNHINDMKKMLEELRRQLTVDNNKIQTLEEKHRPNVCNKDVNGKKVNKEATTPPNKPGGQEADDRVRHLIGTVQELKERLRATELARTVLEKQNERRRRELEEQMAQLGTERDALAERVRELDTRLGSATVSLHDAEHECELVAGLLGVPTVEAGRESDVSVAGRLRCVSGAVRELGEQNERRRRELEEQLAQLGTERDALAERVRELDTRLGSATVSLHDAEHECELVAGLLGVPTVEAGRESDVSVAGRLRCVSGAVRELGEQNERRRRELEEQLAQLGTERDALAERVRELDTRLDSATVSLHDAEHECELVAGLLGVPTVEAGRESDVSVAGRLRCVSGAVRELGEQNERRRRELEEQLAQLGTERDALAERVRELDTRLDSATVSLHDAEHECELVAGLLGVPTVEAGRESDVSVAGRLRCVSGAVRELGEQNEHQRLELAEAESRRVLELEFVRILSSLFVDERNALRSECFKLCAELEEWKRSFSKISVSVNDAVERLGCALHGVSSNSGGDVCVCKGVDVISSSSLVDPAAVGAVAVKLERLASVWHTVGQGQHLACARYYEVACELLRDVFQALGLMAPSSSFHAPFGAREEVLQELLTWTSTPQDCTNVDGNGRLLLARYEETMAAGIRAVETDVLQRVRLAADRILRVRLAYEAVGNALGDGTVQVAAGTSDGEDDSVVAKIRELHVCLRDSLESLVTFLGDDTGGATRRLHDGVSFEAMVKELMKECRSASAAFVDITSLVRDGVEEKEEVPGSEATTITTTNKNNNPKPLVCCYEDLVVSVRRSLTRARGEREKYKRLCEEIRRVLAMTTGTVSVATQSSLLGACLPHADVTTDNISSFADALASQKTKPLFSKEELVGSGDSDSCQSPLGSRHSFEIVHQVRSHIASKVAEVQELRTAVTTSVEKLGGTVTSPSVASHVIANTLLDVVRETSASIADVQALIDPDAAAVRSGPPRLRDLVSCLQVKVGEWEASMREARELVNSVMNVNDPNYSLAASPGRSLTRKSKPKPVVAGRGDESLSLNRTFPVSSESVSIGQLPDGRSVADASPRKNRAFTPFSSEAEGGGVSGKFVQDAVLEIRAKLIGIRQLTNACATAVCLMGGEEGVERQALDVLPVQLLQRAQEVNEVIQLTQDAVSLLDGTEEEVGGTAGGDAASSCPSIRTRVRRLVEGMKALKDENESLRLQEIASLKQKAFLLQDFEAMRDKFASQEKRLGEEYQKLLGECNELRGTIDRRMQEIQERDDTLAMQERRNTELEEERERLHAECDQLRRQITTLRVTRDDLQVLEAGPKEAAVILRRASAFLYGRLQNAINQISAVSSSSSFTSTLWTAAEEKVTEKHLQEDKPEGIVKALDVNDASVSAAQLMAESGRELRRCGQAIQQIELHLRTETQLRHWVRWVCVRTKDELVSEEAAVRTLLREACRNGAVLLSEKMRVLKERDDMRCLLQQRLEEVLSKHDEERAAWKRRLQDLNETQQLPFCSSSAASNVATVREGACELQREGPRAHSRLEQWIIENTTAPLPNASLQRAAAAAAAAAAVVVEKTTELCGAPRECVPAALEFLPAVGGDGATGEWRPEEPLSDDVKCVQKLAEDLSRCRVLLQEQLLMMGEDNDDDVSRSEERRDDGADQRASLSRLMERHKSSLKRLVSERAALHVAWQAAQSEVLRLHRELHEGEERYTRDTEEAGRRIGDLRAIVQQKLVADAKTEREMEEIQSVMDQHLAVLYSYAKEEEAVTRHLHELCRLMRSKTNVQKQHTRLHF